MLKPKICFALLPVCTLIGCEQQLRSNSSLPFFDAYNCPQAPAEPLIEEPAFCTQVESFADPVTITGSAEYQKRQTTASGLGGLASTNFPIRHAEISVVDSQGRVVQCGSTDASGNFSVSVPRGSQSLNLVVHSRANNQFVKASVLNNHSQMQYYSIASAFVPTTNRNIGTLIASYQNSLQGGAFHILDQIYTANSYLRNQASNCATNYAALGCANFGVADQVQAFWAPGCNPLNYFSPNSTSGLSFYVGGTNRLYILGGINGDTDFSDTDHFDASIILHEYGHFIEALYSRSDSPGGAHDGNTIIDPRLAWSEAWATFFAGAVANTPAYLDTTGNSSGITGFVYAYNYETNTTPRDPSIGEPVPPPGEGNFREMAILRALWDIFDANNEAGDDVNVGFERLWSIFSGSTGMRAQPAFLNAGLFFEILGSTPSNPASILSANFIEANQDDYARLLNCSPTNILISPTHTRSDIRENGTYSNSNQFASNDFYWLQITSPITGELRLNFTSPANADLNLIVYRSGYRFGDSSSMATFSTQRNPGSSGSESVRLDNLPPGNYLVNVIADTSPVGASPTANLSTATYDLLVPGATACP